MDKLDRLVRDYVTGNLDARIAARKIALKYPAREDNLGIHAQSKGVAPQEALYLRLDSDELLSAMIGQKEILDLFWRVESEETKEIIKLRYCDGGMYWYQIEQEVYLSKVVLWKRYNNFKRMILPYLAKWC